jgi:CBS domain-containing protein
MICPNCGQDNLPGSEECCRCQQDLTQLDRPVAHNRIERSLMEDPVTVLHPKMPITVRPSTAVREAVQLMLDCDVGALLVVDTEERLIGIFTERDLLDKVVGIHEDSADLPVHQFMTPHPETVADHDSLAFALHKMDVGGYRHLPVLHAGQPIGVISVRDLLRHITRLCKENSSSPVLP